MVVVFAFGHEQGVQTVDGLKLEMTVLILRYGRFNIDGDESVEISEFSQKLKDTFMADFSDSNFDASQVEDHLAE